MSILVKGMEMPESCAVCKLLTGDGICKELLHGVVQAMREGKRHENCPLIEVPKHGDLIDKKTVSDNLASVLSKKNPPISYPDWNDAIVAMLTAPTIIPAEEGE